MLSALWNNPVQFFKVEKTFVGIFFLFLNFYCGFTWKIKSRFIRKYWKYAHYLNTSVYLPKTSTLYYFWTLVTKVSTINQLKIEKKGFRLFVRLFPCHSSTTTVSEFTRGSSTGAGSGKGHVKSASVSSPGPSAAENSTNSAQQADSLGARYKMTQEQIPHTHTNSHEYTNTRTRSNLPSIQ